MDREMRRQYTVLVDFLGHILGPDYEVALHELKDDSNEIIAIANGELTGRHLGSPLSNKMLEYLTSHLYETQDYVLRFESTAITGKKMCSNSLFIKGPHNELAGLLCINFDSSRYQELSARVMDLCSNMLTPGVQSGTRLIVEDDTDPTAETPEKTYPTSIAGATASRRRISSRASGMAAVSAAAESKGRKAGASVWGLHRERTPAASAGQSVRGVPARSRASSTWLSAAYTLRPSSGPYTGTTGPGTITTSPPAAERAASAWSKNVTSQPGRSSRTS